MLADRLAAAFADLPGRGRYERWAVARLEEVGDAARDLELGALIAATLATDLKRDHGYALIERERLADAVREMELALTGMIDPAKAAQAGKLAGAQVMVVGSVAASGADFQVFVRLIDVEQAKVLVAESISLPQAGLVALSDQAVVLRTKSGAIFRSLVVPGWGQFYNREPVKGGVLVGIEAALVAAAVTVHLLGARDEREYSASDFAERNQGLSPAELSMRAQDLRQSAETFYVTRNWLVGAAIGVYLYNLFDAYLFGVDGEAQLGLSFAPMLSAAGAATPGLAFGLTF